MFKTNGVTQQAGPSGWHLSPSRADGSWPATATSHGGDSGSLSSHISNGEVAGAAQLRNFSAAAQGPGC